MFIFVFVLYLFIVYSLNGHVFRTTLISSCKKGNRHFFYSFCISAHSVVLYDVCMSVRSGLYVCIVCTVCVRTDVGFFFIMLLKHPRREGAEK